MSARVWRHGRHRQPRSVVAVLGELVAVCLVWTVAHPGPVVLALVAVLVWASGLPLVAVVFVLCALLVMLLEQLRDVVRGGGSR